MNSAFSMNKDIALKRMFTVTISSGKGGVGKSTIALNLAIALAQRKRQVILLDGDLGLGAINVMLGFSPSKDLSDVVAGKCSISEALFKGPWGVSVLPAGNGSFEMAELSDESRGRLLVTLQELSKMTDVLIIDTGAGIGANVLSFALAADLILVVTTTDITALTDAYGLIKIISQHPDPGSIKLLVNRAESEKAGNAVIAKLKSVARKFLEKELVPLGVITEDSSIQIALKKRKPLLLAFPHSHASLKIRSVADYLVNEIRRNSLDLRPPKLEERFEKMISESR